MSEEVSERIRANRFNIMVIETYNRVKNLTAEAEPDDKKRDHKGSLYLFVVHVKRSAYWLIVC